MEDTWLAWLRQKIESWISVPKLIRLVQIILCNQNSEIGYAAEDTLSVALLDRFGEIEWNEATLEAYRMNYARHAIGILDDVGSSTSKPFCPYNTYRFARPQETAE